MLVIWYKKTCNITIKNPTRIGQAEPMKMTKHRMLKNTILTATNMQ